MSRSTSRADTAVSNESIVSSESALRRRISTLRELGPKRGVARLIASASGRGSRIANSEFQVVLRALCVCGSPWIGEFRKRERGTTKCPSYLRAIISDTLTSFAQGSSDGTSVSVTDVVRQAREPRSKGTLTIRDQRELGFGGRFRNFLALLHDLRKQPGPIALTVDIDCDFVYVHGLAILAAWCEHFAAEVKLRPKHARVERYLANTGYQKVVEDAVTLDAPQWDSENHVALTRVDRQEQDAADRVASRLSDLFVRHSNLDESLHSPLTIVFAELIENVYRHAESNYGSFVMAQAYPDALKIHITVVDTGIGIYDSFRRTNDAKILNRCRSDRAAIDMATEKRVTSKSDRHSGYGLFLVTRLVELNGGQLRITSGRARKEIATFKKKFTNAKSVRTTFEENLPWKGTEISLMFDLTSPLPLREVYRELGPVHEAEDFFD